MAPTAYLEQLEYDVRLMNEALKEGTVPAHTLQHLLVASDIYTDPQALILAPENVIRISNVMVRDDSYVANARDGALEALNIMEEAIRSGQMTISEMEAAYLITLRDELNGIPDSESDFIEMMTPLLDKSKFIPSEYGL
jgi:methanol--5-hydroxybenzimidazolylcobamide Co-methyltransferase